MIAQHLPIVMVIFLDLATLPAAVATAGESQAPVKVQLQIEPGHPWRPPFGLDRVGHPFEAVAISTEKQPPTGQFVLIGYRHGKEVSRQELTWVGTKPNGSDPWQSPYYARAWLEAWPTEVALLVKSTSASEAKELTRQKVTLPSFEAEAVARPDRVINPVDLGTVLVPADWLLLAGGQKSEVEVAALSRSNDLSTGSVAVWYESAPQQKTTAAIPLGQGRKAQATAVLGPCSQTLQRDVLHVAVTGADGRELWQKQIRVMIVPNPPKLPAFGAVETKLRYDPPISVRQADGRFTSIEYASAWDPKLPDVVVAMPNGARFVFWRGSCYIPFWAGRYNTGFCYEWAESKPPADATDAVEPLMDKELRYSRVRIIESTPARVHVRWSYQSCDFNYKVWGDSVVEDFYFYPDGFGTRVLTLQCDPKADYELSELIELTPQATSPLSVLPRNLLEILFLDGQKRELTSPLLEQGEKLQSRDMPAIFRVRLHKDEPMSAIYFSPLDKNLPTGAYGPFYDKGQLVTPVYWGSHWPLARGNTTGGAIDDRISLTPCHNSIVTWGYFHRPAPLRTANLETLDALGSSKPMLVRTWAWLMGMTDAGDEALVRRAQSFAQPPTLELQGARQDSEPYAPERRAMRLLVQDRHVAITIKPAGWCVNPVLELKEATKELVRVTLGDKALDRQQYAWDGQTLWLDASLSQPTTLQLEFAGEKR